MLYTNCDIPAKLFYNEVIGKSNLNALGEGSDEERQKALLSIIDELCDLQNNRMLIDVYKKNEKISRIKSVINTIDVILYQIAFAPLKNDERSVLIDLLNSIEYVKIKFDKTKPILEEIERVKRSVIGMLNNQINDHQTDTGKKHEKISEIFERNVARLEQILPSGHVDINCSLRMYSEYENIAKEIIKNRQTHGK